MMMIHCMTPLQHVFKCGRTYCGKKTWVGRFWQKYVVTTIDEGVEYCVDCRIRARRHQQASLGHVWGC